jgi:hypothetical protein
MSKSLGSGNLFAGGDAAAWVCIFFVRVIAAEISIFFTWNLFTTFRLVAEHGSKRSMELAPDSPGIATADGMR